MMKNFYLNCISVFVMLIFVGCSEDPIENGESQIVKELKFPPEMQDSNFSVEIMGSKNKTGDITGFYYLNDPSKIYSISYDDIEGPASFKVSSASYDLVHWIGDQDNFGYGGNTVPCRYYDLSEPEDNPGNFDRLINGNSDAEKIWTHDFRNSSSFCSSYVANEVVIEIREYFTDSDNQSTILIDGIEYDFTPEGNSACNFPKVQTFIFKGEEAAFANDGLINISVKENGDELALDYSVVFIDFSLPDPETVNVVINGCDTGVQNYFIACEYVTTHIKILRRDAPNHGQFISSTIQLLDNWMKAGIITADERNSIFRCVASST